MGFRSYLLKPAPYVPDERLWSLLSVKGVPMVRRSLLLVGSLWLVIAAVPARAFNPPVVALQAGHWQAAQHAEEFKWLRTSTGTQFRNVREVDLNVDIAHRVAEYLRSWGNTAYVLPSRIPPGYRADAFVSIHGDGHDNRAARGYKIAASHRNWSADKMLVQMLDDEYGRQTGLPRDWRITENMRSYYAFQSGLYDHTVSADTPSAILEMGFLSNATDRAFLVANRDLVARAIALGIARFLGATPPGGWPAAPSVPTDVVEILHNRVPLYEGPGTHFRLVDRAAAQSRFAIAERRPGWAKLFLWNGKERWVQDFRTKPLPR